MEYVVTIVSFLFGWGLIKQISAVGYREVMTRQGKQLVPILDGQYYTTAKFFYDFLKHRVCHKQINGKGIFALILVSWLFLNIGNLVLAFPKYNLFKFNKEIALRAPFGNKYLSAISIPYNSNWFITAGFYGWYAPLLLTNLNKLSDKLFPHSEKARLVRNAVMAEKDLPDNYRAITQINENQVRIDYTGNPTDITAFVIHKRVLSEGCEHELDIQPDRKYGKAIITFKSPYRYNPGDWRKEKNGLVKGKKLSFIYITPNGEKLPDGRRVLKAGETTDLDRTLVTYGRGIRNPYYIVAIPQVNGLNQSSLFKTLDDYRLPRRPDKEGGEFFVEDDGLYDRLDKIIDNLPPEVIGSGKCRFSPEILERTQV